MSNKIHIIFITHEWWGAKNLIHLLAHKMGLVYFIPIWFSFFVIFHARFPLHSNSFFFFLFIVCQSMHQDSNCCGYVAHGLCLLDCTQLVELLLPMLWMYNWYNEIEIWILYRVIRRWECWRINNEICTLSGLFQGRKRQKNVEIPTPYTFDRFRVTMIVAEDTFLSTNLWLRLYTIIHINSWWQGCWQRKFIAPLHRSDT